MGGLAAGKIASLELTQSHNTPRSILIVGGGTAGWMAAVLFAKAWGRQDCRITLMESSDIGTIGVGEGSTPRMRDFFRQLDIPESEWMPACNATYKCGIRFPDWSTRPGYPSYYHPFFTLSDNEFVRSFFNNVTLRNHKRAKVHAHPDAFFVSQYLAKSRRAPLAPDGIEYQTDYAYHFDAGLLGEFLKQKALAWGVDHRIDTVTAVNQADDGAIASVDTEGSGALAADLFVDCTGFAGLLIGKTLDEPFVSYSDSLLNDRAVALPTPPEQDQGLPSETLSTALKYGWAWKIPLTGRFGNGYVYSSTYCEPEQAEAELREHIGQHDASVQARHLKMRIGRRERCWARNCLAVGLSQGFIEPLEATALMLVQETIEDFIEHQPRDGADGRAREALNATIAAKFDGVRDYVFMHYKLNTRADTAYWRDCRDLPPCSDLVAELLRTWDRGGDIVELLKQNSQRVVYSPTSWLCILAGMGRFPSNPKKPKKNQRVADPDIVRQHCEALLGHFPDHRSAVEGLRTSGSAAS
ncbi:MAG: tryptophan halogenase [Salinisphaeraceae bacterium]|nr:tryptophan halogenase [Salinisphaeraceae bacterium]